jgi:hypothetical protein
MNDDLPFGEAFGYRQDDAAQLKVWSAQVVEGKETDTLMPAVVLKIRVEEDGPQVGFVLSVDGAESLADELKRWAARAREKHYE